jgi:NADH dehydrogenase/NADH:ubiquinone oxidoreductase subunit G
MTPDQRQQALTRMTPEQKTNLAATLGYQNGTPTTPTSAAPSNVGVLRAPTMRERFLNPEYYPVGLKGEGVGENLYNLAQRGGVGIFQLANAAMTPRQTAAGLLSSVLPDPVVRLANRAVDLENKIPGMHYLTTKLPEGTSNPLKQAYDALAPGGWQAAGNVAPIASQALATAGFGEAAPAIASDTTAFARAAAPKLADAALFVPRTVTAGIRIGMQDLGGAGKEPVARAAREHAVKIEQAQKDYNDALRAVQEENATHRTEAANGLAEKRQTVEQTNAQTRADYLRKEMEARKSEAAQAAAEAQKQVIERGQRSYATRAIGNAKQTFRTVKAELDQRWSKLRDIIGERPINSGNVAKAIEEAKAKNLMGDPESLKLFDQLTEQLQQPKEFIDPGVPGQLKPTMKAMPWRQIVQWRVGGKCIQSY